MFNFSKMLKQITSNMLYNTCGEYMGDELATVITDRLDDYLFDDIYNKKSKKKNGKSSIRKIDVIRLNKTV